VKGEEAVEIRRQVRDDAVTGIEQRASRGPADSDTVEDGAAILGVDHAPRIGTASSDWLRDSLVTSQLASCDRDRPSRRLVFFGGW
jgi:hypothetical protein